MGVVYRAHDERLGRDLAIKVLARACWTMKRRAGMHSEEAVAQLPGARLINESDVAPGSSPAHHAFARASASTNLFRIYFPE